MLIKASHRFAKRTASFLVTSSMKGWLSKQDIADRLTLFSDEHVKLIGAEAYKLKRK